MRVEAILCIVLWLVGWPTLAWFDDKHIRDTHHPGIGD